MILVLLYVLADNTLLLKGLKQALCGSVLDIPYLDFLKVPFRISQQLVEIPNPAGVLLVSFFQNVFVI